MCHCSVLRHVYALHQVLVQIQMQPSGSILCSVRANFCYGSMKLTVALKKNIGGSVEQRSPEFKPGYTAH